MRSVPEVTPVVIASVRIRHGTEDDAPTFDNNVGMTPNGEYRDCEKYP
jgi:hypothetical protein